MALTKASFSMIDGAPINVLDYGADPTGATDSTQAIKNALVASPSIWFPAGTYLVSETIRSSVAVFINGEENVTIKAVAPFTGIAVTSGGSPVNLKAVFAIFKGNTINDITGARISSELEAASVIGKITIDCDQVADYGVFIERAPYTQIMCNVFSAANTGIWSGVYSWGVRLEQNKILDCITNGVYLGTAANGVTLDNVNVWGYPTRTVNAIVSAGNNNGVFINGGFVERCEVGVLITGRPGPHTIIGVDFEAHSLHNVKCTHDISESRRGGPIGLTNNYFDSVEEDIWNDNCYVVVDGCRFRTPAATSGSHYFSNNTYSQFIVKDSSYDGTGGSVISPNFDATNTVFAESTGTRGYNALLKGWNTSVAYQPTYRIDQYGFGNDKYKGFQSGFLSFETSNQSGPSDLYIGRAILRASGAVDSGTPSLYRTTGVVVDATTTRSFRPEGDTDTALGVASFRWSEVFAVNPSINTSDAREKQQIRNLEEAELATARQLKTLIKAFKWNDAVEQKGDNARIHIGAIAQEVQQAFIDNGLDPEKYSMFCKDVWYTVDGEVVAENKEGAIRHERLGLRYEEMLAFIIAAI